MTSTRWPILNTRRARVLRIALVAASLLSLAWPVPVALAVEFEEGQITNDGQLPVFLDQSALITNGIVYWVRAATSVAKWTDGPSYSIIWTDGAGDAVVDMDVASGKVVWATSLGAVHFYDGSSVITVKDAGNEVAQVATDGSAVVYVENRGGSGSSIDWEVFVWTGSGNPSNISNNGGRDTNADIFNGKVAFQRQQFAGGSPLRTYFWPGSGGSSLIPVPAGVTNPWDRTPPSMGGDYVVWGTGHDAGQSVLLYHIPSDTTENITGNGTVFSTSQSFVSSSGVGMNPSGTWFWRTHAGAFTALATGTYTEIQGQELIYASGGIYIVDGPSGSRTRISTDSGSDPSFSGDEAVWLADGDVWMYAPEGRVPFPLCIIPTTEICDGKDNDCDTQIDEGFGIGDACDGVGACGAGVGECAGPTASRCSTDAGGSADESTPEICDGLDDDCDGTVDSPTTEVNDGLDNSCPGAPGSGLVDEITGDAGFHVPLDPSDYSWPPQTNATLYRVARSTSAVFSPDCTTWIGSDPFVIDPDEPVLGASLYYQVRSVSPNLGSWGEGSAGMERTVVCGSEFVCDDGGDDDGDGLVDCDDPDCAAAPNCL